MSKLMYDSAAAPPVRVDAGQLHHTGQALAEIGDLLETDVTTGWWVLAAAGGGTAGWAAGAAAAEAAGAWRDKLRTCAGELDELGDRFVAAAEAYQRCDEHAAARSEAVVPR